MHVQEYPPYRSHQQLQALHIFVDQRQPEDAYAKLVIRVVICGVD